MADIKIAHDDEGDWIALIKGDDVIYQGHSMTPEMVLEYLNIDFDSLGEYDLEDEGWFPDKFSDWGNIKKIA